MGVVWLASTTASIQIIIVLFAFTVTSVPMTVMQVIIELHMEGMVGGARDWINSMGSTDYVL